MILHLATELQMRGRYLPRVVVYDQASGQPTLHSEFEAQSIPVSVLVKGHGFSVRTARELSQLARAEKAAILHTHDLGPLIYGSVAGSMAKWGSRLDRITHPFKRSMPFSLVHTQHSFVHLDRKKRHRLYERYFANRTSQLCVVSADAAQQYETLGVKRRSIELVENGVSFTHEPPLLSTTRLQLRERLLRTIPAAHLSEAKIKEMSEKTWVHSMARLHPRKGQDHLIHAWQRFSPETRKQSMLFLVGPETFKGERNRLESMLTDEDRGTIWFTGSTSEPHAWNQASDGMISASEFEGMPLGPIEALGEGLPLCLSEIAGHEVLRAYSTFFPISDPSPILETWTASLTRENDATRLARWKNAETIRTRWSLSAMVDHYESIYDRVLLQRSKRS